MDAMSILLDDACIVAPLMGYWFMAWAYVSREADDDNGK
jgi:hypothetical protein